MAPLHDVDGIAQGIIRDYARRADAVLRPIDMARGVVAVAPYFLDVLQIGAHLGVSVLGKAACVCRRSGAWSSRVFGRVSFVMSLYLQGNPELPGLRRAESSGRVNTYSTHGHICCVACAQ